MKNFFMKSAFLLAQESKCVKYKVGAIIVKDKRIVSMGYNGTPPSTKNCCEVFNRDDFDRDEHRAWSIEHEIHAEMNAIAFAAKNGLEIDGCDMYVTLSPCNNCLKNIVMSGIKNLYYFEMYNRSGMNETMLEQINVQQLTNFEISDFKKILTEPYWFL